MAPPLHYAAVLFPGFQLLDLAGPLDLLNFSGFIPDTPNFPSSSFRLTLLAESLSPVPTKPSSLKNMNPLVSESIVPTQTFECFLSSSDPIDVLFVPGGIGTREPEGSIDSTISFIRTVTTRITTAVISVCTGADVLASAGLLNNRQATTNHMRFGYIAARHADKGIAWLPRVRWVKSPSTSESGLEVWTSAGVSAGIDVMLAFIEEKYGEEVAVRLARMSELDWKRLRSGEVDPLYDGW